MTQAATRRSAWDAIVQRALLGTERGAASSAPAADGDLGALLARIDTSDAEAALLAAAALVGAHDAAGRLPARTTSQPVAPAALESEDLPAAPPGVARFLVTMLGGVNDEVLPEWLAAVAARGWRVPTPLLPALLDAGHTVPALRKAIASSVGARGRWLAERNDDWHYAVTRDVPADDALRAGWDTGTPDERRAILEHVRARDAALGRTLLESTWDDEAPSQRATLLALLEIGVGRDDEAFLESALDDRRQEVRRIAASLLRRISGSAHLERLTARAEAALDWKPGKLLKRAQIIVEPPSGLDAAMARDGVEKKPPSGMGERAWWLAQILAAVPPGMWSRKWNATPEALISSAAGSDWAKVLTEGWSAAAVRHRDAAWAEALLSSGSPGENPTPIAPDAGDLLGVLPVDRQEAFITRALRDSPSADIAVSLVAAADHAWSEEFARAVVKWMRKRVAPATFGAPPKSDWQLRALLPLYALRIPTALVSATDDWPSGDAFEAWAKSLERFIAIFTFRRELHEELER